MREEVQGACEILGLDPLYIANEGRFIAFIPEKNAQSALEIMRSRPVSVDACLIGRVTENSSKLVTLKNNLGVERIIDMLTGDQLPRIC